MPTDITLTDRQMQTAKASLIASYSRGCERLSELDELVGLFTDLQADQQMDSLLPQAAQPPSWQPMDKSLPAVGQWAMIAWADQHWGMWFVLRTESGWLNREGSKIVFDTLAGRLWHPISPLPAKGAKL